MEQLRPDSHLPLTLSLTLLALLLDSREFKFLNYFCMPKVTFEYNLPVSKIEGHIKKEDTFYREAISSTERLAVCLR